MMLQGRSPPSQGAGVGDIPRPVPIGDGAMLGAAADGKGWEPRGDEVKVKVK